MKIVSVATWIVVTFSWVQLTLTSLITLQNGGYKGILVAIHHSVPEDEQLIINLKALFTDASKFLHSAMEERVYFKEITIAVPSNWTWKPEYIIESGNHFAAADIQVDHPNPFYGDVPYTEQPGGCGEPGQYIHLTPRFVKDVGTMTEVFGRPERQLVHEWAHLRYGVFDEYGIPGHRFYPSFYIENDKVRPTSCTGDVPGWIRSLNGGKCCLQPDGQVGSDCLFVPDVTQTATRASIMSMPFLSSVDKFCNDGQHSHRKHNTKAPTRQNAMCNYESTWSVISRHEDFRNMNIRSSVPSDVTPTFQIIQSPLPDNGRYVLVLDVSRSMKGSRSALLRQAATRLIEDRIPHGASLGIVQFGGVAMTLSSLTTVNSATRLTLSSILPTGTVKGTAIGKGLREAVKVLKDGSASQAGGLIILITDGEENVSPSISTVAPEIVKERIVVNTVAFGTKATEKLEKLTKMTGGKAYFFGDLNGVQSTSGLDSAFLESVTVQSDVELQQQRLTDEIFNLERSITRKTVIIDSDLGKDTMFTVTSPSIGRVIISLKSPGGIVYGPRSKEYDRDVNRRERIEVYLPQAESGKWQISFSRLGAQSFPVTLSVTSKPMDSKSQPITVKTWLSDVQVTFPGRLKVFASVRKGYKAVIGATVKARVEGPTGNTPEIILRDDGADADITKDDGIYTGFFTQFDSNGRYAVTARVLNDGKAKLKTGTRFSGSRTLPTAKGPFSTEPATEFPLSDLEECRQEIKEGDNIFAIDPVELFQRESDGGSFLLKEWNANIGDVIPPGDIRDLSVLCSEENFEMLITKVTLQWTSVGDDLDCGKVASNELWVSADIDSFIKDLQNGVKIPEEKVVNGSLKPLSPGQLQTVTVPVQFFRTTKTLYFGMKSTDDAGNISQKHNMASLYISAMKEVYRETDCN